MKEDNRLFLVYRYSGPYLYGALHVVRRDVQNQETSYPFVISKQFQGREIVYGSVLNLMEKVASAFFRFDSWQRSLDKTMPDAFRASIQANMQAGRVTYQLPEAELSQVILHQVDERLEDAILVSSLHLRNLLEVFSGKGDRQVGLYDYEDNRIGTVSLKEIADLLMHHRYFVIRHGYLCDLYSGYEQLTSPRLFGSKIEVQEMVNATLDVLGGIRIRDFAGMLRSRLERLSVDSEPRDIIFLIQNIHSLSVIIQDRISDSRFPQMLELLFRELRERQHAEMDQHPEIPEMTFTYAFRPPTFKVADELSTRQLAMDISINGKVESFLFGYEEFFGALTGTYGDDALVSLDQLKKQVSSSAEVG